jgi:hypothetical protein
MRRAFQQQRPGQTARSGADFYDGSLTQVTRGSGNTAGQVEVKKEMLTQLSSGAEMVPRDHLPQRR